MGKQPTINAREHRSVNRAAPAGSTLDIYRHNPWRAPGSAPVLDACGLAGGTPWRANVSEWGDFVDNRYAAHGDAGSKVLAPLPTGVVWKAGGEAEAVWQIGANHVRRRASICGRPASPAPAAFDSAAFDSAAFDSRR